jgi:hypothetical protein
VSSDWQALDQTIDAVLTNNPELVEEWLQDAAGSWGALAGRAVIARRDALRRPLNDGDRRMVWQRLWDRLTQVRLTEKRPE